MSNFVIIGGVALGPKVACRIKRMDPAAHVTVVDKDKYISYGGCGIPYYVGGDVPELSSLFSTSAEILRDPPFFHNAKGVDVRVETEAVSIDRKTKSVRLKTPDGTLSDQPYDTLILATGAVPVIPPIPGANLPGVTVIATPHHAENIKKKIAGGEIEKAVVIGGGAIGLEMAEALGDLWGVETTLVEMADQLLPGAVGPDMALPLKKHMEDKGISICLSEQVNRIQGSADTGISFVETTKRWIPCDLVVIAAGVRPNTHLAKQAGLEIGETGGIRVDKHMRTSDLNIYAGGDCVEISHLVSGQPVHMPLGSLANRQGRVIGTNAAGGRATFPGTVGTFCVKAFDMTVARAGLTIGQASAAGFDAVSAVVSQADRAHFYPTQQMMCMKLTADRNSRQILGVEAIGGNGDAVKARVDAVAALLPHKITVDVISNLEVAYAPPFASAMDIINSVANVLENTIEGRHQPVDAVDFLSAFHSHNARVLDVRSRVQAEPYLEKYGRQWQNIPQEELRNRLGEVKNGNAIYLLCGAGPRSYEAQLLLRQNGITDTKNIQGGMKMLQISSSEFS
ncbi:MAG: FAD-dependent oxidoreductase [Deltaproteobacteria bacterium]|nr:FAD-dependent oxidoreductase [Deltaproteobacteria bacterium]